jgi:hypothetical protein
MSKYLLVACMMSGPALTKKAAVFGLSREGLISSTLELPFRAAAAEVVVRGMALFSCAAGFRLQVFSRSQ